MGLLEGKRLLITGVLTPQSLAFHVASRAQEEGAEVVLSSFGRMMSLTERTANRLEKQRVVLTVPASFDESARELTVEAAKEAGLTKLTLLEEPQAAFYDWMSKDGSENPLPPGATCVVVDCGGGGGAGERRKAGCRCRATGREFTETRRRRNCRRRWSW